MNWSAIGAIGEVIGGVGVIVTLAYLALQIRQNTKQLAQNELTSVASAVNASLDLMRENRWSVVQNPELTNVWLSGLSDPEKLSEENIYRFRLLFQNAMDSLWHVYSQTVETGFSEETWKTQRTTIERITTSAGGQWFWSQYSNNYPSNFRSEIENIMAANHKIN